ncbi:helix-turn-helix transcriptional regulator [Corynebacterium neomassiliense]|uniref:helix-turn-helix transcriptional regulator n=1 Tax=Corynebacterium neomassiliense TaxID=2079482 RepID=UPI003B02BBA2
MRQINDRNEMESMTTRTGRMLRLLDLLDGGTAWPAPRLAGLLDIPERTLRRDIAELRGLGYGIEGVSGPGGYYRMPPGKRLPPKPSQPALSFGQSVEFSTRTPGVPGSLVLLLAHAADEHREVTFTHIGRSGTRQRAVEPARLVHLNSRWYLHGWDRDRRDWRTFRLDRVNGVTLTGNRFTPVPLPHEDVTALLREQFRRDATIEIVLELAADPLTAATILYRVDGTLEAIDDSRSTRYTAFVDSFEWMAIVLLLTDIDFTVISPAEFRRALRKTSDRFRRGASLSETERDRQGGSGNPGL